MDEKTAYKWFADTCIELARLRDELDRANAELDAIDAALGEFYIPVRDPVTDEPGGAFYQDHGVHLVMEQLARTKVLLGQVNGELEVSAHAIVLVSDELVHQQDEVARLRKGAGCGTQKANAVEDAR